MTADEIPEHVKDVGGFLVELNKETDRGLPLVAAALIDAKLLEALQGLMCEGEAAKNLLIGSNSPLGSFAARINACYALGLIDSFEYNEITLIRKIRNKFAHAKHGLTFESDAVKDFCRNLKAELPQNSGWSHPRQLFTNSAVSIVLRLYFRGQNVAKERRVPKVWVDEAYARWHSISDKKPPPGSSFVSFVVHPSRGPMLGVSVAPSEPKKGS